MNRVLWRVYSSVRESPKQRIRKVCFSAMTMSSISVLFLLEVFGRTPREELFGLNTFNWRGGMKKRKGKMRRYEAV